MQVVAHHHTHLHHKDVWLYMPSVPMKNLVHVQTALLQYTYMKLFTCITLDKNYEKNNSGFYFWDILHFINFVIKKDIVLYMSFQNLKFCQHNLQSEVLDKVLSK